MCVIGADAAQSQPGSAYNDSFTQGLAAWGEKPPRIP